MNEPDLPIFFGEWLKRRRHSLDLTQAELAARAGCSVFALRKIEAGERRPSRELAGLLADALEIVPGERPVFVRAARDETRSDRLPRVVLPPPVPLAAMVSPAAVRLRNWPAQPTSLVGREDEMAALGRLLRDPLCRLLTLIGPGGIGKTRLAVEVAAQTQAHFAGGVCFVPLAPLDTSAAVVTAIADALGFALQGQMEPQRQLLNHLANQHVLLVLDNAEHLLESAGLFNEILAQAPGLKLLVTSRERLNLQSEWVFVTQGLPVPAPDQLARAHDYDAIRLFVQRAQRVQVDFAPQGEEMAAVVQICQMVEGMPLGIELAAAWVTVLSCREIAHEIGCSLNFLQSSLRDLPARQRSLRVAFDHSWRLLTDREKKVLGRLAVFRGGFERTAVERVAAADLATLLGLVSKSLVRRKDGGRYDLHEVVRQYAFAHLAQTPDYTATCDRHSQFYLALLRDQEYALHSHTQHQALRGLTCEIDNLRAAWDWAVKRRMFDALAPAVRCFGSLFELSGWLGEGVALLEPLVEAGRAAPGDPLRCRMLGEALAQQALLLFRRGDFAQARARTTESLAVLSTCADLGPLMYPLLFDGIIRFLEGDLDLSQDRLEEALRCAQAADDPWGQVYADFNLGYLAHLRGDHQAGYARMCAVLAPWRAVGDPRTISLLLNHLSPAAVQLGRYQEAETFLREGLALCQEMGDRWGVGTALRYLGEVALAQGDPASAEALLRQSLAAHQGFVTGWDIARTLIPLGDACLALGHFDEARQVLLQARQVAQDAGVESLVLDAQTRLEKVVELAAPAWSGG